MSSTKLQRDEKEQAYLKNEIKFLAEETFSAVIEIIEGKELKELDQEKIDKLKKYSGFENVALLSVRENIDT